MKGNRSLQLRDHFGMLFDKQRVAHRYSHAGKPARAPARLAVVTLLQFLEGVGDQQAADNIRDRSSWN